MTDSYNQLLTAVYIPSDDATLARGDGLNRRVDEEGVAIFESSQSSTVSSAGR